jgi:hypothetical protein
VQRAGFTVRLSEEEEDLCVVRAAVSRQYLGYVLQRLFGVLPGDVYVALAVASRDIYREYDLLHSELPVSKSSLWRTISEFEDVFLDDGFLGFGAISYEPRAEVFLDEHKLITVTTGEVRFVHDLLRATGIPCLDEIEFYPETVAHSHMALGCYKGFESERFDYCYVRDLCIDQFDLAYQEDEFTEEMLWKQQTWIVDYSCRAKNQQLPRWREVIGLKACNRREALYVLDQTLQREESRISTIYEMFRIDPSTLEGEARAAAQRTQSGVFYRWALGPRED